MSKLPVRETSKAPFSPKTERVLTLVQVMFPMLTAIAAAVWAVNGYLDEQKNARAQAEAAQRTRQTEARRPFLELQLSTYTNASAIAGKLASLAPETPQWKDARDNFYALYWSQLSLVEDDDVKARMVGINRALQTFEANKETRPILQSAVYCLAVTLKESIARNWQIEPAAKPQTAVGPKPQSECR